MFLVYFRDVDNHRIRYYWHKSGCWTMWRKRATPVNLEKALQLLERGEVWMEPL